MVSLDNFAKKVEPPEDKNKYCRSICAAPWTCDSCSVVPEGRKYPDYMKVIKQVGFLEHTSIPMYDIPCDKCGKMIRTTDTAKELCPKCKPKKFVLPIAV